MNINYKTVIGGLLAKTSQKAAKGEYHLPPPSDEQRVVVAAVAAGNVVVQAVAGLGKSTTIIHIALANPESKILNITFNARLRLEMCERCVGLGIENISVHTYHSFGYKYIGPECHRDVGISNFLSSPQWREEPAFDILIIDECQDMNRLYYDFMKITAAACRAEKIIVLGDPQQAIYCTLNESDNRYLRYAPKLWGGNWTECTLSISYRITKQMAEFINSALKASGKITAEKSGPRVQWFEGDPAIIAKSQT